MLGLEWGQGSRMGPGLEQEQGLKLAQALWWGFWIGGLLRQRHVGRKTGKATLGPASTPTPHPVRLMPPPNLLPGRRDCERGTA